MTNEPFTASNGIAITPDPYGARWKSDYGSGTLDYPIDSGVDDALAEWYQHRRDAELGRWRSKEHPNYVVYPQGSDAIEILCETDGRSHTCGRDCPHIRWMMTYKWAEVQDEYFAAHPEPEPKPWQDAKPGEVWVIKLQGDAEGQPVGVFDFDGVPHFSVPGAEDFSTRYRRIESGYRIWPTETNDE